MNNPRILALLTVSVWSFGPYLARLISMKSQFVLLFLSSMFSLLMLLAFFFLTSRTTEHATRFRTKPSDFVFGPLGYFVYTVSLNQSLRAFNSASEATLLNYTWPLFTIVFTLLIFQRGVRQSLTHRLVRGVGIALGFLAVVVLATEGDLTTLNLTNTAGVTWGLMAGASYGLFSAYSSTVPKERNISFLIVANAVSLALLFIGSLSEVHVVSTLGFSDVLVVFVSGAALNGLGYITWTRANRLAHDLRIDISVIASMMFALPVLSLMVIALLLGESSVTHPFFLVSLMLLIFSMVLCQRTDALVRWFSRYA